MSGASSPDGSPALELALAGGTVELWVAEPPCTPASLERARALLAPAELARCERVLDPVKRGRMLLARAALRAILARRLAMAPLEVPLARDSRGRPLLRSAGVREDPPSPRPAAEELSLSFSHSASWVAVALGRGVSVGVDIEPRAREVSPGVIARVLSPRELESLEGLSQSARREAFLRHWTLKEAGGKALGAGLGATLERLELVGALAGEPRLVDPELAEIALRRWDPLPALIGAVAARPPASS
jgi:4'-phosphopantetheinyl transferase